MENGKNPKKYFVGLDVGTDSVGYAVTDERYRLCRFKGEHMWGVTLFEEAQTAEARRGFRTARRRLDRRQQRLHLLSELFAEEIGRIDEKFFWRIQNSYLIRESDAEPVRLFGTYAEQKKYCELYPTIHHLICELMNNKEAHDVRYVYLACAWLLAHRGHFLNAVDKENIDRVLSFDMVYEELVSVLETDGYVLPWDKEQGREVIAQVLRMPRGVNARMKKLSTALFAGDKIPKEIDEQYTYNYDAMLRVICGGTASLSSLFGKAEYDELEEKSLDLSYDDVRLATILQSLGDDAALVSAMKAIYDWAILTDILPEGKTISEVKVAVYEQHAEDLKTLKYFVRRYLPKKKYSEVFRDANVKNNYVAYSGNSSSCKERIKIEAAKKEDFCKFILSVVKAITPEECDKTAYEDMLARLDSRKFLPKQVESDNRVIPYQVYWYELNCILENAKGYLPFLLEKDDDGWSVAEKILSIFEFRIPYYVGPLKENKEDDRKKNHWMVRKAEGYIYPWNFTEKVDLDQSEEAFIKRMTNKCTYLPGEDVLPKCSLVYSAFSVLNGLNNIRINGNELPVDVKQGIYNDLFLTRAKVSAKAIRGYLESRLLVERDSVLTGAEEAATSSLKSFLQFRSLLERGCLNYNDVEKIIARATCTEDSFRFLRWLKENYPHLEEKDAKYIAGLKFLDFGRLSKRFLCSLQGTDKETGETFTLIRAMWETNNNLMQLLSDRFTFKDAIAEQAREYFSDVPKTLRERLDEMYVSNGVKRPIIRTMDVLTDIVRAKGGAPTHIFVEMARGANEDQKGRTISRLKQLEDLYDRLKCEEVPALRAQLALLGEDAHNKLQSDKIFLYFIQLGRCLYTDKPIDFESVLAGDGKYNIEHIYPRSFVKDDSVINNKILVDSTVNGDKSDVYPVPANIRLDMAERWSCLHTLGLISDEKYKRLTRTAPFTEEEQYEFINRQLVETRQSTKVLTQLLQEAYPDTTVVYVKAGLVSEFRKTFDLLKSRTVNDLHHAKDAYLNIVVGNVWREKFWSRRFAQGEKYNIKAEVVFTHKVMRGDAVIWRGTEDIATVKATVRKHSPHMTMYSYYKHSGQSGGFFDQNLVLAGEGLIERKKGLPTELYGGYSGATISGFALARYLAGKRTEISLLPVKLLVLDRFVRDKTFALKYAQDELGEKAQNVELLFNHRVLKIGTMLSLDGLRLCLRGLGSSSTIGLATMAPFMADAKTESYIKRLESLAEKHKKNPNIRFDEKHDMVSAKENLCLYELFIKKLSAWPYNNRPGNSTLREKLSKQKDAFAALDPISQATILLQVLGIFGRVKKADLSLLKESASSGIANLSLNLSAWRKSYSDVRIVDASASGLYETVSDNLLDLL